MIKILIDKLKFMLKGKIMGSGSLVLFANIISQVESFVFVMLATRVLTVDEYGMYSIIVMILTTVTDLADMGMNGSVIRFVAEYHFKKEYRKEKNIISIALKRKLINSSIIMAILIIFSRYVAGYLLDDPNQYIYIVIVAFGIGFSLVSSMNTAILQGRQWYKEYFYSIVISNLVLLVGICILYFTNTMTLMNIVIINIGNILVTLIISYILVKYDLKDLIEKKDIEGDVVNKFKRFGNWMLIWSVFSILQSKIDIFMLAKFTTKAQVSYYDIAMKMTKPILMVTTSYAQVLNPILASITSRIQLKDRIGQIIKIMGLISGILVISMFLAKPAITIIFGNKYDNSIIPLIIILAALIFYIWTIPFNSALYALNKPHIFAIAALVGLIITVVGNLVLLSSLGAIGASITFMLAQVVSFIVAFIAYKKNIRLEDN